MECRWSSVGRSLIEFDLRLIPASAVIDSAKLYLFSSAAYRSNTLPNGHSSQSHANTSSLYRILAPWDEAAVTWNNQPLIATNVSAPLPQSATINQNYVLDLQGDVANMVANPSTNYGWMLKMNNENYYAGMFFYSSDNTTQAIAPKLVVKYNTCVATDASEVKISDVVKLQGFPNPSVNGKFELSKNVDGVVYDSQGNLISTVANSNLLDLSGRISGVYVLKTNNGEILKVEIK
ncbi:MAG: DNRLRE domain-containing protein [Cytophagales bacterium]